MVQPSPTISTLSAEQVARAAKGSFDASHLLEISEQYLTLLAVQHALKESKDDILAAKYL